MKHIKKIEIILTLMIGAILISFLFAANAISSPNTNLKITRLKLDKSSISPNEAVNLTYSLKPEGMISQCFNMGMDVKKGERKERLKSWGLPSKLCDDLRQGRTISQTWKVDVPDWGTGSYVISIVADVDNYLKESNRADNRMEKTLVVTKAITGTLSVPATLISAAEELYLIDVKETPGKILQLVSVSWSRDPVLRPVYTRTSGNYIYTVAFHKYSSPCFVDLSHKNIYRTDGLTEKTIFSHTAPIQDIDYDSRGRIYVSVAPGAGRDGVIYHLKPHSGEITSFVNVPVPFGDIRGFWNGYFAFDSSDKLYLSVDHPNQSGASIYEYVGGRFEKRFTHNERITGFTFADHTTLYFTTYGNKVYKLRNFKDLSIKYKGKRDRYFNDVVAVKVPNEGVCQISGLLQSGKDLWPITYVEAYGPNVVWRKIEGSSIKVSRDGSFVLRNLPAGRYRIRADIHGETGPGVGFEPAWRIVNCGGQVKNIKFKFSR